jgi:hypothetical protein
MKKVAILQGTDTAVLAAQVEAILNNIDFAIEQIHQSQSTNGAGVAVVTITVVYLQ